MSDQQPSGDSDMKNNVESPNKKSEATQKTDIQEDVVSVASGAALIGVAGKKKTAKKQCKALAKLKIAVEFWKPFLECFAFAAAGFVAWINYNQWQEMREDRHLGERAWVNPFQTVLHSDNGLTTFYFILNFKNIGKTPALNIAAAMDVVTNIVPTPYLNSYPPTNLSKGILFPDVQMSIKTREYGGYGDIASGKTQIFPYGIVTYDDIFGKHHWIRFCFAYDIKNNVTYPALVGNDCDGGYR
jgi:hypothetical protein